PLIAPDTPVSVRITVTLIRVRGVSCTHQEIRQLTGGGKETRTEAHAHGPIPWDPPERNYNYQSYEFIAVYTKDLNYPTPEASITTRARPVVLSRQTPEPKIESYRTHKYLREYSGNTHASMLSTLEPSLDLIAPENTNVYASRHKRVFFYLARTGEKKSFYA
ncbi:hypothetical protein V1477_007924, partial [Vespula maculifrons]